MILLFACARTPSDPAEVLLRELDADGSGRVEAEEAPWMDADGLLGAADRDRDGALDREELRDAMEGRIARKTRR